MTTAILLSLLPDNDQEPTVKRASVPLVKLIDGHWCWKEIGRDFYAPEPELEQVLVAALKASQGPTSS